MINMTSYSDIVHVNMETKSEILVDDENYDEGITEEEIEELLHWEEKQLDNLRKGVKPSLSIFKSISEYEEAAVRLRGVVPKFIHVWKEMEISELKSDD